LGNKNGSIEYLNVVQEKMALRSWILRG